MSRIYLDHAATTPLRPEAREAMLRGFEIWANPSSPHAEGRKARAALEEARERVKVALGWDGDVIFTSGASEALAIGLGRAKVDRRIVSAVEHDAVFRAAPDATVIGMDGNCFIDRDALVGALKDGGKPIVALQALNSETGTIQDVSGVTSQVREAGGLLLSDCSQSAGKERLADADMIVISAHKFGGPIGIGALLVRDYAMLEPSGGQERGYRSGTENLPAVLGMEAALSAISYSDYGTATWIAPLIDSMIELGELVSSAGGQALAEEGASNMLISSFAMPGVSSQAQLIQFDAAGFAVSAGSACSSGSLKASRVLTAFGVDPKIASTAIRVSFGWTTTSEEIDRFGEAWLAIARKATERAA